MMHIVLAPKAIDQFVAFPPKLSAFIVFNPKHSILDKIKVLSLSLKLYHIEVLLRLRSLQNFRISMWLIIKISILENIRDNAG